MFTFTKGMGYEIHKVLLVGVFDWKDHFDQMLSHTSTEKGQSF